MPCQQNKSAQTSYRLARQGDDMRAPALSKLDIMSDLPVCSCYARDPDGSALLTISA
jgi:hypothetical protein